MSGERESLWGERRRRATPPAEDRSIDDGASPKERHVLDLQQKAGNSAVAGVVQRSLWGDLGDWFGGGGSDSSLKAGGAQPVLEQPGIKGGGSGFKDLGSSDAGGLKGGGKFDEPMGGEKDFKDPGAGFEEPMGEKDVKDPGGTFDEPMGEKDVKDPGAGFEEPMGGEKDFKDPGAGFEESMGEKGSGGYEAKGDTGAYDGGEHTDAEKGYADREEKGGYDGWGDEAPMAPTSEEPSAKGGDVWIN